MLHSSLPQLNPFWHAYEVGKLIGEWLPIEGGQLETVKQKQKLEMENRNVQILLHMYIKVKPLINDHLCGIVI